jgi:RimJ/RimL family protein N-acetyltransferase
VDEVQLREVREADLPILFENQRDPEAIRLVALKGRDREDFTVQWAKILVDETVTLYTILFNGAVAGHITSFDREGVREVGYWIGKRYWGKGVATAALEEFLRLARSTPPSPSTTPHRSGS